MIPLGVDVKMFHPLPKEDKVFRVLYVGTMSLQKGLPYLLEATESVSTKNIDTTLIGSYTKEIQQTFNHYDGKFHYLGVIPRIKLNWHYSQASIFVLASVQDGFGVVLAQAMACGIPIIATTNTGAKDLITDGVEGFIVPIRDPKAIREKILYLYENPDVREQMGQAALKKVQSLGGWDEHGRQTIQALKELVKTL